jgi:hypothetical protein
MRTWVPVRPATTVRSAMAERVAGPAPVLPARFVAVSCASSKWCMAVGSFTTKSKGTHSLAAVWHPAGQWHDQSAGLAVPSSCGRKCFRPGSLSCGSPVNCMEFSRYANLAWNGTGLRPAPSVSAGRGSLLGAVSCGTSYCMAVGHKTGKGKIRAIGGIVEWHDLDDHQDAVMMRDGHQAR